MLVRRACSKSVMCGLPAPCHCSLQCMGFPPPQTCCSLQTGGGRLQGQGGKGREGLQIACPCLEGVSAPQQPFPPSPSSSPGGRGGGRGMLPLLRSPLWTCTQHAGSQHAEESQAGDPLDRWAGGSSVRGPFEAAIPARIVARPALNARQVPGRLESGSSP